jgi:hypothetical protein
MAGVDLLKISRAVDGDNWFVNRIKIACRMSSVYFTDHLAIFVALAVQDDILVDENKTVDTSGVSDDDIIAAVKSYTPPVAPPAPPAMPLPTGLAQL